MADETDAPLMFDDIPSFDDMPDAPTQPQSPGASSSPLMFDDIPSFDDMKDENRPQAEGQVGTFAREAAHSALPAAGGMVAAGAAGALGGAALGPAGAFAGAVGGMIIGSMATDKAQQWSLDQLGMDDSAQRAANTEENPYTAFAGGLAPAVATMSPVRGLQVAQRAMGAGMMGGFEAGQEYLQEGKVDPLKVAGAATVGAVLPQANRAGEKLIGAGERVAGRPNAQANPAAQPVQNEAASSQQPTVTGDNALAQPAPSNDGNTIGNPQSRATTGNIGRDQTKGRTSPDVEGNSLTGGMFSPDVAAALRGSLEENSVQPKELPPVPQSTEPGLNPGEQLPIHTGIEEAHQQAVAAAAAPQERIHTGIEDAAASQAPQAPTPATVGEFKTSKGSQYQLHEDGSTTRNKSVHPEHPGDEGPKPKSEKTYYLTGEQANALAPPQGKFRIIDHGDGTLSTATPANGNRWGIAPSARGIGPVATEPQHGLHPLELWAGSVSKEGTRGYDKLHFGNEVTEINGRAREALPGGEGRPQEEVVSDRRAAQELNGNYTGKPLPQATPEMLGKLHDLQAQFAAEDAARVPAFDAIPETATVGEKPEPKVVTAAVTKMRESGVPEEEIARFKALTPGDQLKAANRALREKTTDVSRPDRIRGNVPVVEGIKTDEGNPVTARDKGDAARKSADVKTMNDAHEALGKIEVPNTPEEKTALKARLQTFLDATKGVTYKPALKHEPYVVQRAAKKLLTAKNPTDKGWASFVSDALVGDEARATQRIEADIGRNKRAGDEAVASAEAKLAENNDVENEAIENVNTERAGKAVKELDDYFKGDIDREDLSEKALATLKDMPKDIRKAAFDAEEGSPEADKVRDWLRDHFEMPKGEEIKTDADIKRVETKLRKLDITTEEGRASLQKESGKLADNLIKTIEKREAPKASEGAASAVRKVALNDPEKIAAVMKSLEKAQGKNKSDEAGAMPREQLGEFWDDKRGALNTAKIARDFRNLAKPTKDFLTKAFGKVSNDRQRRGDATLAQLVSDKNSREAEVAKKLFDAKYYQWLDDSTRPERITYIKALEEVNSKTTPAQAEAILIRHGMDATKAKWMSDEAAWHRSLLDEQFREDAARNSNATYRPGYVPHIFDDKVKVNGMTANDWLVKNVGPTWYQKQRTFNSIAEAMKAGFKLAFDHPHELINARLLASVRANTIVDAARALQKDGLAFPADAIPAGAGKTWTFERKLPDGKTWKFAPDTEHLWTNAIEPVGLNENQGIAGSLYRGWMQAKRVFVPVTLALSAFHELHIVGNIMPAQELANAFEMSRANGEPLKNYAKALKNIASDSIFALPLDKLPLGVGKMLDRNGSFSQYAGRQVQDIWKTPDAQLTPDQHMIKQLFKEAGVSPYQSREDVIGAKVHLARAIADFKEGNGSKAGNGLKIAWEGFSRGMEKLQEPMFKYQIPALKNAAVMRAISAAFAKDPSLATNPTLRKQVLREVGKDIDDRFGEMFYGNLFWNKTVKDVGVGSMLSLSWNLGQFRQVAGAVGQGKRMTEDLFGKQRSSTEQARKTASNKIGFISHYVGLSMMTAGAVTYALTGEMPTGMDYIFPRNGLKNDDGSPGRVTTPFNTREAVMLKAHADEHGGGVTGWMGGAMQLVWNKMVLQPLVELATNKDFFGKHIYDPNSPWYKQALQGVDSTLGRTLSPITISGADRAREAGGSGRDVALSYAGFGPAPKYVNESPLERRINHLYGEEGTPNSKPYEYGPKTGLGKGLVQNLVRNAAGDPLQSEARSSGEHELARALQNKDSDAAVAARKKMMTEGGMSSKTAGKYNPQNGFQFKFAKLPDQTQMSLAKNMTPDEFKYYVTTNKAGIKVATRTALLKQRDANK